MRYIPELQDNMFRNALGRHRGAAETKWNRLTAGDIAAARTESLLVRAVETRYDLPHATAARDVHTWVIDQT